MCVKLDLSILGCVKVKVLWVMFRLTVAEGELRRLTVAEVRSEFLFSGS